ncbi:MAG: hypothetical protein KAT68_14990 [Bacteroidales bacterium]|nr:hypothetical protein [Bacteroidales bacterium]
MRKIKLLHFTVFIKGYSINNININYELFRYKSIFIVLCMFIVSSTIFNSTENIMISDYILIPRTGIPLSTR